MEMPWALAPLAAPLAAEGVFPQAVASAGTGAGSPDWQQSAGPHGGSAGGAWALPGSQAMPEQPAQQQPMQQQPAPQHSLPEAQTVPHPVPGLQQAQPRQQPQQPQPQPGHVMHRHPHRHQHVHPHRHQHHNPRP